MQAQPQKTFSGLNSDWQWTESATSWIYSKVFQLALLALRHATLLHQHGGLFTMYELVLTFLSLHQTTSHCKGKDKGNPGANAAMTVLGVEKDFVCGGVCSSEGAT